jgi:hypothetical protein
MTRTATITAVALAIFAFPDISQTNDACPCYTEEEILVACPRPDSEHTEVFNTGSDGKSLILKCLATQNYSPGSIMFDAAPGDSDNGAYCGRQSVEVEPYGSGGEFPQISSADYVACKATLEGAAEKLGLSLVMDEFSKNEILSVTYRDYIKVRDKAETFEDIIPFLSSDAAKELQGMPADIQKMMFVLSQEIAGPLEKARVISESIDENQAVIVAEYCSPNSKIGTHTAWYILENTGWKIRKEYDSVGQESCGVGDEQTANSCTNDEWDKSSARLNELIDLVPAEQQDNLYNEAIDATLAKFGNEFCSQPANECECNDEAVRYLEAK